MKRSISFQDHCDNIEAEQMQGFFQGWSSPHSPQTHLDILKGSTWFWLAVDTESSRVVGFVTAISDGIQSAFIPMHEVLPEYKNEGIGTELMNRILKSCENIQAIDLMCDPELQDYYKRFDMFPSTGMIIRSYLK